jgi:broad specificity phosphatase PhoE
MRLYVIRHGQTDYNVLQKIYKKGTEMPINQKGRLQAQKAAEKLKNKKIEMIITSEHFRAKQTAEIINNYHKANTKVDKRLNDIITGFEGKPVLLYRKEKEKSKNPLTAKFNDGESFLEIVNKIKSFIQDLKKRREKSILIVSHEDTIKAIHMVLKSLSYEEAYKIPVKNADIFEFEI